MRHALFIAFVVVGCADVHAEDIKLNGRQFTIPDGFVMEVAAGKPLTEHPISADFDELGRLYVTESSGSNEKVRIQLEQKPHSILRLEDVDGDGVFDKRTVFADRMMFPEGALWFDGSLYVCAPPQIWKLTDIDDDGVADRREVWFDGKTLNGCANDLHGPFLGPDGWIYWCKGAFEEQTYERPGRKPLVTRASHIFRRRPEGGVIESVMTGGMDNPVDVAFSRGGERFFTTTFLTHPRDGLRDGIIHAIYGGVYGKEHGVLAGHPRTGELMPPLVHMGAAAPCGMIHLQSKRLGDDNFDDSLLACQFNKHKVSRHVLTREGGSFTTRNLDFVSSPDLDFHPTDVIEDADGSVLIIDTGGWYKLCCPTSQLYKPDIPGAIYRVRRKDAPQIGDARGNGLDWPELLPTKLAEMASDGRHVVRERAKQALAKLDKPPFEFMAKQLTGGSRLDRLDMVWALCRIDHPQARELVRTALADVDQDVRGAAVHAVSVWKDDKAIPQLHDMLVKGSLADMRVAAEAIGRMGSSGSVIRLIHATRRYPDRYVEHSLIHALIEIGDVEATEGGLNSSHSRELCTTLIALDQMDGGEVDGELVVGLLDTNVVSGYGFQTTCWWLIERHPEWGGLMAAWFDRQLQAGAKPMHHPDFVRRLALFAGNPNVQTAIGNALKSQDIGTQVVALKAMAASRVASIPDVWAQSLPTLCKSSDKRLLAQAVSTIHSLAAAKPSEEIVAGVERVATDSGQTQGLRLQAFSTAAIARQKTKLKPLELASSDAEFICEAFKLNHPAGERALAVDVLIAAQLRPQQLGMVASALKHAGPMELKRLLAVFQRSRSESTGTMLLGGLNQSPAALSLDPKFLGDQLAKFGEATRKSADELLRRIAKENEDKLTRIDAALAKLDTADERRGQAVFHATKTSCLACHQMGYLGGNIGPSLRRIGNIRSERDLLESILFPSASFVRSYEPVSIVTTNGKVFNGVVRDETPDEIVLALDAQKTVRIRREDIEERHPGKVSIMPAGLDKQLSDQDLADLVRFLKVSR